MRSLRRTGETGAALVEAALVLPTLTLLLAGLLEFGLAWQGSNDTSRAIRAAVLEVADDPGDRQADYDALLRLATSSANNGLDSIDWVVIYRIDGADATVPAGCLGLAGSLAPGTSSGITDLCNVFSGGLVAAPNSADFDHISCVDDADRWFCPATRRRTIGRDDRIGVAVQTQHRWVTGILGSRRLLNDAAIATPGHFLEDIPTTPTTVT